MTLRALALAVSALLIAGCTSAQPAAPGVLAADAWARTTDGAERPDMTAVFVNLTNPSDEDRVLVEADCGDVAEKTELHVMENQDGKMVMVKAEGGMTVPAGKHWHLAPGGPHIMLMGLTRELPAGSEELTCTLTFDDGQTIEILAPVKQFTEEQDSYHEHAEDGTEVTPAG
ncbi:copper chaperone PCu(A)C [Tessaracoccus sp. MC1756]|uniref:copper chaperone PCu(A)C n=1 Tax=Tessaracoccus sp. MC1756 TaxID=2760311 RepID=UPI0015FFF6A7|nr:copper chaperone PCu(A)C [Tessaracoccus sp. MC1756]MBB1509514.1 copper chaperone PCu(A)C [Tessaracoccus sp. MC1756]